MMTNAEIVKAIKEMSMEDFIKLMVGLDKANREEENRD